jgi:DNA polymerase I-like protein with 3'-5' exonuclease and polymerase domains
MSGADMVKDALVRVFKFIKRNNLPILIVMTVHDQIDTLCPVNISEKWAGKLKLLMEESAKLIIPSGFLKAEVGISPKWQK